jgi:hypothetical protein
VKYNYTDIALHIVNLIECTTQHYFHICTMLVTGSGFPRTFPTRDLKPTSIAEGKPITTDLRITMHQKGITVGDSMHDGSHWVGSLSF